MSKNTIIGIVVVIIILVVGGFILSQKGTTGTEVVAPTPVTPTPPITQPPAPAPTTSRTLIGFPAPQTYVITYTDSGFSPKTITINLGDTVTFKNQSSDDFWPASAVHPTHTVYPGSGIQKCGTAAANTIFDACGHVKPGASWSVTFTNKGSWGYHDHLNAGRWGTMVVSSVE